MGSDAAGGAVEVHDDPDKDRAADSEGEYSEGGSADEKDDDEMEREARERHCDPVLLDVNEHVKPAHVPEDWVAPVPKTEQGEPAIIDVDNPGNWHSYAFRPKFEKKKYVGSSASSRRALATSRALTSWTT